MNKTSDKKFTKINLCDKPEKKLFKNKTTN